MALPLPASPHVLVTPIQEPLDVIVQVAYTSEEVPDIASWNYISGGLLEAEVFPGGVGFNGGTQLGSYCPSPSVDPNCHTLQVPPVGSITQSATDGNALATFQWPDSESYWWFEPARDAIGPGEFEPGVSVGGLGVGGVCVPPGVDAGSVSPIPPPLPPNLDGEGYGTTWDSLSTIWDSGFTTWDEE